MRQIVGFADWSSGVLLGANLGRAIVTNGDFTAYVCDSASTVGAAREREVLGFSPIFTMGNAIGWLK